MIKYIAGVFRKWSAETRRINDEYARAYRQCYDGTPEEVERKLAAWDSVHRATRSYRSY